MSRVKFLLFFLMLFVGCVEVRSEEADSYENTPGDKISTSSSSGGDLEETSTSGVSSSSSSTGGVSKFDVGTEDVPSCKKLDFLFVIDNSGSMQDNQENLVNNYESFIDGIIGLTGFDDFHIGVITTDHYAANSLECGIIGGLVVQTEEETCGPWSDGSYMLASELNGEKGFTCAAKVGVNGDTIERPIESIISSMGPFLNSSGECNEGFFREDARLVVVIITDEDDSSEGVLSWWLGEIEFFRKSLDDLIVMGLIPVAKSECTSSNSLNLRDFISSFPDNAIGDVCDEDYGEFFGSALETIDMACNPAK